MKLFIDCMLTYSQTLVPQYRIELSFPPYHEGVLPINYRFYDRLFIRRTLPNAQDTVPHCPLMLLVFELEQLKSIMGENSLLPK